MELEKAKVIADVVVKALEPYCDRIEVAGSIRRQKPMVNDIFWHGPRRNINKFLRLVGRLPE